MTASTAASPPVAPTALNVLDDPLEQGRFTRWVVGPFGRTAG
jgi:hypothetical protein